jgi:hypothetical protein
MRPPRRKTNECSKTDPTARDGKGIFIKLQRRGLLRGRWLPACGELDLVEGEPLALGSYETSITISGFADGQTLDLGEDVLGTCVVMEHSWLRDLQIELTDLWASDNGFIFSWKIKFDPNLVDDCDDWVE